MKKNKCKSKNENKIQECLKILKGEIDLNIHNKEFLNKISNWYSNEDIFIYDKYKISAEEQIGLLNGYFLSQISNLVCFDKKEDLENANLYIKKYGIHRIEETR